LLNFLKKISKDKLVKDNFIFFVGSMAIGFLSYLFYPIIGRLMRVEDFGEVQFLISLFAQLTIIFSVFGFITVNIVSNSKKRDKLYILTELQRIVIFTTSIIFVLIIFASPWLGHIFKFRSFYPFIILAVLMLTSVFFLFRNSFLQGKHDFKSVSILGILNAAGKILFAVILIIIGFGTFGAILGLLIAQLLALVYAIYKTKKELPFRRSDIPFFTSARSFIAGKTKLKKELHYGIFIFALLISITILYTADVLIVKRVFSPYEAGQYSGIAAVARIIFFAAGSIAGVLLPSIKKKNTKDENRKILKKSFILFFLVSVPIFVFFVFFPRFVITLLFGEKFALFSCLLPLLSFSIFMTSFLNLIFIYCIALRRYFVAVFAVTGAGLTLLLSVFKHNSITAVITNFVIGNIFILAALALMVIYLQMRNNHEKS